jgi:hypothetical protein
VLSRNYFPIPLINFNLGKITAAATHSLARSLLVRSANSLFFFIMCSLSFSITPSEQQVNEFLLWLSFDTDIRSPCCIVSVSRRTHLIESISSPRDLALHTSFTSLTRESCVAINNDRSSNPNTRPPSSLSNQHHSSHSKISISSQLQHAAAVHKQSDMWINAHVLGHSPATLRFREIMLHNTHSRYN